MMKITRQDGTGGMAALLKVPEGDLYSIFDELSDGVLVSSPAGEILYRNHSAKDLPEHLEERTLGICDTQPCGCGTSKCEIVSQPTMMEGWRVSCKALGENKLILVHYDNQLGLRIQTLREQFAKEIAEGTPASMAAMKVLRDQVDSRWVSIGHMDWPNERIVFDLTYDREKLRQGAMPPLHRNVNFNICTALALTENPAECFTKTEPHTAMGVGHIIGMSLKNAQGNCIGYALLADEEEPENLKETVTLLQEMAALYGPYFEAGSAKQEVRKALADANTDVVTGHGNRRAYETHIQECLADMKHEMEDSEVLAMFDPKSMRNSLIMLIDFDGFKRINDVMGHDEGDRALRLVSDALAKIDEGSRVFRLGGDEMVQVFTRSGTLDAEELRQRVNIIEREMEVEGFDGLGLSIGVVHFFEGEGSPASMMALADARMYHDKRLRSVAFV